MQGILAGTQWCSAAAAGAFVPLHVDPVSRAIRLTTAFAIRLFPFAAPSHVRSVATLILAAAPNALLARFLAVALELAPAAGVA